MASDEVNGKRIGHIQVERSRISSIRTADRAHPTSRRSRALARGADGGLEPHGVPGATVLAHGDGQGVAEEPERAVVDRPVRRRVGRRPAPASFLATLVLLSLSLGFLNLLPIPILDGGQIVFQLVEWLKGSPLSERTQVFGQQVGIALLIVLMGVALYNDIARQFS